MTAWALFCHDFDLSKGINILSEKCPVVLDHYKQSKAAEYIFGYACGLDMTRRDVQLKARESGKPWDLGKNFEQSAVLSDISIDYQGKLLNEGCIELKVNGVTKQSANLNSLIWNIAEIIEDLSKFYHLQPGDLIYTGTPEGVGAVIGGDRIDGSIASVGQISLNINYSD